MNENKEKAGLRQPSLIRPDGERSVELRRLPEQKSRRPMRGLGDGVSRSDWLELYPFPIPQISLPFKDRQHFKTDTTSRPTLLQDRPHFKTDTTSRPTPTLPFPFINARYPRKNNMNVNDKKQGRIKRLNSRVRLGRRSNA